jgi:hypothetical protein
MRFKIEIQRRWDPVLMRTEDFTPARGHAILLVWEIDPWPIDAGPPAELAGVIATALTELGEVAFRWAGPPAWPHGEARMIPAPNRGPIRLAADWLTRWPRPDLFVTRSAVAAAQLFELEWATQGQVVLVIEPHARNIEPALEWLREARDWRNFVPAPPVIALMAPIVDGDGALLAASSKDGVDTIVTAMARAFSGAAIADRILFRRE